MIRRLLERLLPSAQRAISGWSYRHHHGRPPERQVSWVVGPQEIASMSQSIAAAVPNSFTFILYPHPYYSGPYDFVTSTSGSWIRAKLNEAWLFGKLAAHAHGFIYVGAHGFLATQEDARAFEFEFLKSRGVKVVCYFTGSDIRSLLKIAEVEQKTGLPNGASYLRELSPVFATPEYDLARRQLAEVADAWADVIFNASVDQASYLQRETQPFMYFLPEERIKTTLAKFDSLVRPVVLHAASSPIPKGTQLVRAAVAALRAEGYDFEYIEMFKNSHDEVQHALEEAHIVLNQFYAYVPGVFGVEALAAGTVVLTSADERIEKDLPARSNEAWMVTYHYQVTEHLRRALEMSGSEMLEQAVAGQNWVREHATATVSGSRMLDLLEALD